MNPLGVSRKRAVVGGIIALVVVIAAAGIVLLYFHPQSVSTSPPTPATKKTWCKTFGGCYTEKAYDVEETEDGGFIVVGYTDTFGRGYSDVWLVKIDANGNIVWNRTFGGGGCDGAYDVVETDDGCFVLFGYTGSFGGGRNFWMIKINESGEIVREKKFGGPGDDYGYGITRTSDGGFILTGSTASADVGIPDAWIIKTDADGNMVWNRTFGGSEIDVAHDAVETQDGGIVVTGYTESYGNGGSDAFIIKIKPDGEMVWERFLGGVSEDIGKAVRTLNTGGFIIAGYSSSSGEGGYDFWLIKTDAEGIVEEL
ncbi:MAG: hypothetical protein QXJ27_04800 [Thermoplasmata archaeon]